MYGYGDLQRKGRAMAYLNNDNGGKYAGHIVQTADHAPAMPEAFAEMYRKFATRICWMDGDVVPGAFQMNTAWYTQVPEDEEFQFARHQHDDADELIGYFGSDPENPEDLGAVIEVGVGDETFTLTKSSIIFLPAGLAHGPIKLLSVDRPVFHFSVVTKSQYDNGATH